MKSKVLIIGNGFDLDLGLNTRYSDFAKSKEWNFDACIYDTELEYALLEAKANEKWFDIEKVLESYGTAPNINKVANLIKNIDEDKIAFDCLKKSLANYLRKEQEKPINTQSLAAQVLSKCVSNGFFSDNIFSFNYTDLYKIAEQIGITSTFDYKHVHGCLHKDRIILGVREEAELRSGYEFLRKTFSHHYRSTNIPYALEEANEVIIFGHSLSPNDYHYFDTFFRNQCSESMTKDKLKHITFFTYNDDSEIEIKKQLWAMNNHRTDRLFSYNDVTFIQTSAPDRDSINTLFRRLDVESIAETNKGVFAISQTL